MRNSITVPANPISPMSDQDSIDMISSRQVMGKETKCQLGDYWVIQNQNLLTDIIGIV